jgi:antitoxin component YwqK of YwqJK toxin-antitoxin module
LVNQGKITRKTRVASKKGLYTESIFYKGNIEIARFRESGGRIYNRTGKIPDGRVEFFNDATKTHGEEFYKKGKKHGLCKEYYETGKLKKETQYFQGKMVNQKEYYINGALRKEQDSGYAFGEMGRGEKGKGKIYYRDGTLKYEWRKIKGEPEGYVKSYDRQGRLESASYFDEDGNLIKNEGEVIEKEQEVTDGG